MEKAEVVILRLVHSDAFSEEIATLGEVVAENHNDPRAKSRRRKNLKWFVPCFDWTHLST